MVYYDQQTPPSDDRGSGCFDAVLITRALFGLLFWPLFGLTIVMAALVVTIVLFLVYPALALIPVAISGTALWLYARWEQRHYRPPGL